MNTTKIEYHFYQKKVSAAYRFGDVLRGYFLGNVSLDKPNYNLKFTNSNCGIDLDFPEYCVLLSPCCSIGDKTIYLTPLKRIKKDFLQTPFLVEDLTRINRIMLPSQAIPPERWEKIIGNKKEEILGKGPVYVFGELFVYSPDENLKSYQIKIAERDITINHYMIDFRDIYKVNCNRISSAKSAPLEAKILEISVYIRKELRDKLSSFFSRTPDEDRQILA